MPVPLPQEFEAIVLLPRFSVDPEPSTFSVAVDVCPTMSLPE